MAIGGIAHLLVKRQIFILVLSSVILDYEKLILIGCPIVFGVTLLMSKRGMLISTYFERHQRLQKTLVTNVYTLQGTQISK